MPLAWLSSGLPVYAFIAIAVATILVGIWSADRADAYWRTHDSGRIVIDEVAGYFVTVWWIDRDDWTLLLLGFVLFRLFDIVKPPPVRWLDRNLPGGTGVVIDDVAAGVLASASLYALWASGAIAYIAGRIAALQ